MHYFLHITDTHFGPTKEYLYQGISAYENFTRVLKHIRKLPYPPSFCVHTGDIAGNADVHASAAHYKVAFELLKELPCPTYYVRGNHDEQECAETLLPAGHSFAELIAPGVSRFVSNNLCCILLDGFIPSSTEGTLSADTIAALRDYLEDEEQQVAIFLHYPLIPINSKWSDGMMLLRERQELLSLLSSYCKKIIGVFHGHVHLGAKLHTNGLQVICAPSTLYQFYHGPDRHTLEFDTQSPIGFNLVGWDNSQLQIFEYRIPQQMKSPG